MKNFFMKTIGLGVIGMLLLSASKPSIEGRAIVADEGKLPPGLYITAAAFLPGDTVIVTNPAAKISIEVLVFGTSTAGDGVAAVLSPAVAKRLFISKDSNSIVQITKIGIDESIAMSRALNAIPKKTVNLPPRNFIDDEPVTNYIEPRTEEVVVTEPKEEVVAAKSIGEGIPDEKIVAEPKEEVIVAEPKEEVVAEEPKEEVVVTEPKEEVVAEEPKEKMVVAEPKEEKVVPKPIGDGIPGEKVVAELIEEMVVAKPLGNGIPKEIIVEEPKEEVVVEEPKEEMIVAKPLGGGIPEEMIAAELIEEKVVENPIDEGVSEEAVVVGEMPEEMPEEMAIANPLGEKIVSEDNGAVVEKMPNILIPTQEHPPELAERIATDEPEVEFLPEYFVHDEPQVALVQEDELVPYTNNEKEIEEYVVDNIQSFGKGNFFIQLATYKDKGNINKIINEYAEKYPVHLVKSETLSDAYQVVVGPLNQDEYTIVLQRFVSWGFEDAFLRLAN